MDEEQSEPEYQPIFNVPTSVLIVIGVFVVIHVIRSALPADESAWLTLALAFIPARYTGYAPELPGGEIASLTSFVTHMAVHGDLTHLAANSLWLLAFGSLLARRFGAFGFINFTLITGIVGALFYLMAKYGELIPVIGASGAVSGHMAGALRILFGAMHEGRISDIRDNPGSVPILSLRKMFSDPRIVAVLCLWIIVNYLFAVTGTELAGGSIAWQAHLGGFLAGLFLIGLFDRQGKYQSPPDPEI